MEKLKYARAFQNNGPDYFVVNTGKWKAPVFATTDTEPSAELIVRAVNAHDELVKACKAALECQLDGLDENTVDALERAIARAEGK